MPPIPEHQLSAIKEALFRGQKIEAIKLYREATSSGLAEAKEAVEKLETELRASSPEKFTVAPTGKGCIGVLALCCAFTIALGVVFLGACSGPLEIRKTQWTIPEVKEWYAEYHKDPHAWDGILYQGSDSERHHFVARVLSVDNWAIIEIKKSDLSLPDERPHNKSSSGKLGFYYVDPSHDFSKIRDY